MVKSRFEELRVWRDSFAFSMDLSRLARGFPPDEKYDLTQQLRRAGRSVPANIAEGVGSPTPATFVRHLGIALGSLSEIENHLLVARAEGYITDETCRALRDRAGNVRGLVILLRTRLLRSINRT
jgi:four helix bundle protein